MSFFIFVPCMGNWNDDVFYLFIITGVVDGAIEGVFHCAYADLDALLPECTAIVHGGGVGTVAAAVTHATPQLVCPSAFDQYDNGQRVARRGVGEVMWAEKICEASRSKRVLKRVRNLLWRLSDPWETNPYRKQYVKLKRIDRTERAGRTCGSPRLRWSRCSTPWTRNLLRDWSSCRER